MIFHTETLEYFETQLRQANGNLVKALRHNDVVGIVNLKKRITHIRRAIEALTEAPILESRVRELEETIRRRQTGGQKKL